MAAVVLRRGFSQRANGISNKIEIKNEKTKNIPDIQELRDEIQKWSRMRSSNAPNEAASALQKMVRFYGSSNKNNKEGKK